MKANGSEKCKWWTVAKTMGTSPDPLCWTGVPIPCWLQDEADNYSNRHISLVDCSRLIKAATTRDF